MKTDQIYHAQATLTLIQSLEFDDCIRETWEVKIVNSKNDLLHLFISAKNAQKWAKKNHIEIVESK